jgi:hypothetical protein
MSLSTDAGINFKRDSAIIRWIILQDMQPDNHNNLKTTSAEDCQVPYIHRVHVRCDIVIEERNIYP